eukprot:1954384-Amphidinium_carterae.2
MEDECVCALCMKVHVAFELTTLTGIAPLPSAKFVLRRSKCLISERCRTCWCKIDLVVCAKPLGLTIALRSASMELRLLELSKLG